jgi:urea transport system substrate-binding protein
MSPEPQEPEQQPDVAAPRDGTVASDTRRATETGGEAVESPSIAAQQWVGKRLGKYQVTELIGAGGMGFVLKAHDPSIERDVAIKMLAERMASNATYLRRFRAEAKAAGKLNHANVATIYEVGQEGDINYLAMELLTGGSVADDLTKNGACTPLEATRIMIDACRGIAAAHAAGLVHRDIKPANLVRAGDRTVKVTDFGLAKLSSTSEIATTQLTQAGTVIGTPHYMSPEQCQGQAVDARSDIYALGATYFSLLTGKQPFEDSGGIMQVMFAHCSEEIPDPRALNASVPLACAAIVARAMAKAPAERYQSVTEMLGDLQSVAATLSGEVKIDLPSQSGANHQAITPHKPISHYVNSRWAMGGGIGLAVAILLGAIAVLNWNRSPQVPAVPQGEPIKVGVLQSLSGTLSTSGTSVVDATLLAIDEINASGGLLGRSVEAVIADGRSDANVYAHEAERLITQEHVSVVLGGWMSASRKTIRPIFEEHDHLLLYPAKYEGMETSPNIVYLGAVPNQQIIPAVKWANETLGKQRFYLVGSDCVFPRSAGEVIKDLLTNMDAEIVGESYIPMGSTEFDAVVQDILAAKPDMILNTVVGDSNIAFCRDLREADITTNAIPSLLFNVGEQELRLLDIADVVGDYAAQTYFQSLDTAANKEFVKRFLKEYPQRVISDPMEAAYVGVHLWAQAVREAQSIEPKQVRRAMLNQRLDAPEGAIRIDPETQHCFKTPRIGQIQDDGQFRIVWSASEPLLPEPYPDSRTAADWKAYLHDLYTGWGDQWTAPVTD